MVQTSIRGIQRVNTSPCFTLSVSLPAGLSVMPLMLMFTARLTRTESWLAAKRIKSQHCKYALTQRNPQKNKRLLLTVLFRIERRGEDVQIVVQTSLIET